MTSEEFEYLKTKQAQELIEQYIDQDPVRTALKVRNAALMTQIKNLQKCRTKLPSYYAARCLIPTISYQQSSSEATARLRNEKGELAFDLTCGLGVDTLALSQNFDHVISVEIDPLRAEIARHNFKLLGRDNIEVVTDSAEQFINTTKLTADLIYIDPSRRDDSGRSVYAVQECHPNVLMMQSDLQKKGRRSLIKLSPMFDVQECYRLFGNGASCNVVSVNNECKEVLIELSDSAPKNDLTVTVIQNSDTREFHFAKQQIGNRATLQAIEAQYICVPDVGFYKSRTVVAMMQTERYRFESGYIFTEEAPQNFCGAVFHITEKLAYQPKQLRKRFKQAIIHLKDFPYTVEQIGLRQGGTTHLFFATYEGEKCVFTATHLELK